MSEIVFGLSTCKVRQILRQGLCEVPGEDGDVRPSVGPPEDPRRSSAQGRGVSLAGTGTSDTVEGSR